MDLYYRVLARITAAVTSIRREEGQTFTEYAVIVGLIAVGVVAAVGTLRTAVTAALSRGAADI